MGLFKKIKNLFSSNDAHKNLLQEYSKINELASELYTLHRKLREYQTKVTAERLSPSKYGKENTESLQLKKTEFIEEFLHKTNELAASAEKKFFEVSEKIHESGPEDDDERNELQRIVGYLQKVHRVTSIYGARIHSEKNNKQKLELIYILQQEIIKLSKEFHFVELYEPKLARKVLENEVSEFLKQIYHSGDFLKTKPPMQIYRLTEKELRTLEEEAHRINVCRDPRYKVEFRRWWKDLQMPESDKRTGLKDPHIHVTIKLSNGPKKEFHLLLKAA